jgi:membrane associated rhomboid family serine protease
MKNALRILGSLLIALGISVLVAGCVVGIAVWIVGLFQAGDYTVAVGTSGVIFVLSGYLLRWMIQRNDK